MSYEHRWEHWADDALTALNAWETESSESESARHRYRFAASGEVAVRIDTLMADQEEAYDRVLELLDVPALDVPVQWHLYEDTHVLAHHQIGADAWGEYPPQVSYPAAGLFVRFLHDTWGLDVVKSLYGPEDFPAAVEAELGLTLEELEGAWRETLP